MISIRSLMKTLDHLRDVKLGLFGERITADQLASLSPLGYEVFNDLPCVGRGGPFNIDHVVADCGVVIVVETKTYRKRPSLSVEDFKVAYDGNALKWPDFASTDELVQVRNNADWLEKEIREKLGVNANVKSGLSFPGWYVTGGPSDAPVLVGNTKLLPSYIRQRFRREIGERDLDLIKRHLRSLCADVEFAHV